MIGVIGMIGMISVTSMIHVLSVMPVMPRVRQRFHAANSECQYQSKHQRDR